MYAEKGHRIILQLIGKKQTSLLQCYCNPDTSLSHTKYDTSMNVVCCDNSRSHTCWK